LKDADELFKDKSMRSDQDGELLDGMALVVIRLLQHTFHGLGGLACGTQESDGSGTLRVEKPTFINL